MCDDLRMIEIWEWKKELVGGGLDYLLHVPTTYELRAREHRRGSQYIKGYFGGLYCGGDGLKSRRR